MSQDPPKRKLQTKRKGAPVDTVRLKKDIQLDDDAAVHLDNQPGDNPRSKFVADQRNWRGGEALRDRRDARIDTLSKARSGKIPATAGKRKK